ncbi:MAG: pilus assembly protein [Candidatus Dadabacteria bacterium]|nr:MAG: pilus assembly protein [Candidatus Dadabacteria bacterium]
MIGAALSLPIILAIILVIYDLTRIYLARITAKQVALTTARIAVSTDVTSNYQDFVVKNIVNPASGEASSITKKRKDFYDAMKNSSSNYYCGKSYLTTKEKRTLNLSYGYLNSLNPKIAFPTPYPLNSKSELGGVTNCSIYFYTLELSSATSGGSPILIGAIKLNKQYNREYWVACTVPLVALNLLGVNYGAEYLTVKESALAYKSGTINP